MASSRLRDRKGKEVSRGIEKSSSGSSSVTRGEGSYYCYCDLPAPLKTSWTTNNPGRRFWGCATYNSRTKSACKFFKWKDNPTCARGKEVLKEIMKKVNELEDENGNLLAKMKDLENERDSCMERVRQLQKGDDKRMEIINCLEKQNVNYRARAKFLMYALSLSWVTMLLIGCVALMK
ncbi:uncharacterized protein LOC133859225 [Alnus glutinosa]|uniref:uncharacterized protein LOC133859225 n=1 Tax=Alnus glutinosa TaxID=3517 RepID=UPI002D7963AA|nr:uncharacterized protein LOC133859225 [Alnus glutinosa]